VKASFEEEEGFVLPACDRAASFHRQWSKSFMNDPSNQISDWAWRRSYPALHLITFSHDCSRLWWHRGLDLCRALELIAQRVHTDNTRETCEHWWTWKCVQISKDRLNAWDGDPWRAQTLPLSCWQVGPSRCGSHMSVAESQGTAGIGMSDDLCPTAWDDWSEGWQIWRFDGW
jgi:hypothetical protein